jgi:hypothetical protein
MERLEIVEVETGPDCLGTEVRTVLIRLPKWSAALGLDPAVACSCDGSRVNGEEMSALDYRSGVVIVFNRNVESQFGRIM